MNSQSSQKTILSKKEKPAISGERKKTKSPVTKKDNQVLPDSKKPSGNYAKFSQNIFKGDLYLPTIIKGTNDPIKAKCLICLDDNPEFVAQKLNKKIR